MKKVFDFIRRIPGIEVITIAISRAYLPNDEFAFMILAAAFRELETIPGISTIRFEPFIRYSIDRSLKAQEYRLAGQDVPIFDIAKAPDYFRVLMFKNRERILVGKQSARWNSFLNSCDIPGHYPGLDPETIKGVSGERVANP